MMMIANVSQANARYLPQAFKTAQASIHLPEIQEMLCRLAEYNLGIFIPHMHDEQTGEFQPLSDDMIQVESGLEVSFQPKEDIIGQSDRFLPVGWSWRAGAATLVAACEMVCDEGQGGGQPFVKHTMFKGD